MSANNVQMATEEWVTAAIGTATDAINAKIPTEASSSNQLADKQHVTDAIAAATSGRFEVVAQLPSVASAKANVIYLVPRGAAQEQGNVYDEYIVASGAWEKIGSTNIDLTSYAKKTDLAGKADKSEMNAALADKANTSDVTAALAKKADLYSDWSWDAAGTAAELEQPTYNTYDEQGYWWVDYLGLPWSSVETGEDATELHFEIDSGDLTTVTATRIRLPTMADIPTDNAQLTNGAGYATTATMNAALAGKADAGAVRYNLPSADVESSTTTRVLDTWTVLWDGNPVSANEDYYDFNVLYSNGTWTFAGQNGGGTYYVNASEDATELTFNANDLDGDTRTVTATRDTETIVQAQLQDRTMNRLTLQTLPTGGITLVFPNPIVGKIRDFLLRLNIPAGDAPQIAYPEGVAFENADGSFPEIATDESAAASTLLMFTETAPAVTGDNATPARFLVKGEALKEIE